MNVVVSGTWWGKCRRWLLTTTLEPSYSKKSNCFCGVGDWILQLLQFVFLYIQVVHFNLSFFICVGFTLFYIKSIVIWY